MERHGSRRVESRALAAGGVGEKNCGLAAFMPCFIYVLNALSGNRTFIALRTSNNSKIHTSLVPHKHLL